MRRHGTEDFYPYIGQVLREERVKRGMTQQQVADVLGVDPTTIVYYEAGANRIRTLEFVQLCEALALDAGEVIREARSAKPWLFVPGQRNSLPAVRKASKKKR